MNIKFVYSEVARCPNESCGSPIYENHASAWCLNCGRRFPEEILKKIPNIKVREKESESDENRIREEVSKEKQSNEEIARCLNPKCNASIFGDHSYPWCKKCGDWLPHETRERLPGVLEYGEPPDPKAKGIFPFENASAGTFNGIGTTLYGHADPLPDGSYIATKWFVLLWIPLFPLASFRIKEKESSAGFFPLLSRKTTYDATPVLLNKKQIRKAYILTIPIIITVVLFGILASNPTQSIEEETFNSEAVSLYKQRPNESTAWEALYSEAETLRNQGLYDRAEVAVKEALQTAEKALGSDHPDVAKGLSNLALLNYDQGKYTQAEPLYKRALAIWERMLGPDHPDVATSLSNLAGLYEAQGKYEQAEPLHKRSLSIMEKVRGPDHPSVATSLNNLATLYFARGQYTLAEPLNKRALAIFEKVLGPDHPNVATSLNNLAALYDAQGQYTLAEPLYKRALAISEKVLGPDHPSVATGLNNLADLYETQGKYEQAEPLYKRSLTIIEKVLGPDHPNVATSLNNLAALYDAQGQYILAEPLYKRALAISEKVLGPDHPFLATILDNFAELYRNTDREEKAWMLEKRAAAIRAIKQRR